MEFNNIILRVAGKFLVTLMILFCVSLNLNAQNNLNSNNSLSQKQKSIILISALTAKGDLQALKPALNKGLETGLTINEIKEMLVHLYAYCGFPRSIHGLQTFMNVMNERQANAIKDQSGPEASPIYQESAKYERGKKILEELTKTPQGATLSGYSAFAPTIDTFLKEHLFADIFERDILTFAERELVTISVIATIGNAEPMLRSHLAICLNVGYTPAQLNEFGEIIKSIIGENEKYNNNTKTQIGQNSELPFPKGELVTNNNFTGETWLNMFVSPDNLFNASIGNVTFEPSSRTNWHIHPGGQILLVTDGQGFYQEKGKPAQIIQKGDVVKIPSGVEHWHGASSSNPLTHIAFSMNVDRGSVKWLLPVTDEEYKKVHK